MTFIRFCTSSKLILVLISFYSIVLQFKDRSLLFLLACLFCAIFLSCLWNPMSWIWILRIISSFCSTILSIWPMIIFLKDLILTFIFWSLLIKFNEISLDYGFSFTPSSIRPINMISLGISCRLLYVWTFLSNGHLMYPFRLRLF